MIQVAEMLAAMLGVLTLPGESEADPAALREGSIRGLWGSYINPCITDFWSRGVSKPILICPGFVDHQLGEYCLSP